MDLAFNHIEDSYVREEDAKRKEQDPSKPPQPASTLTEDISETYKAFSASPWGAKIGGFLGTVRKQGESVYSVASKELAEVGQDATKGFAEIRQSLASHTRNLSLNTASAPENQEGEDSQATPRAAAPGVGSSGDETSASTQTNDMLSRIKAEAAKRLKDLQKAEDAADEALLKFGSNVRDFLKDAITIAPPEASDQGDNTVLFESKDAQGKRVVHQTRYDAQLHVIHTSPESFSKDPDAAEYAQWTKDFDVEKKTDDISADLKKYEELRTTMEKLVPDQIPYADFWRRYYFLRHSIETAEARRRDLLKAAAEDDDSVGWDDDDSDDETDDKTTVGTKPASGNSSTTLQPKQAAPAGSKLKPEEARKSHDEKSQADSEASYDVVGAASGKTSQAPNSPLDSKKDDDSDDDWE